MHNKSRKDKKVERFDLRARTFKECNICGSRGWIYVKTRNPEANILGKLQWLKTTEFCNNCNFKNVRGMNIVQEEMKIHSDL